MTKSCKVVSCLTSLVCKSVRPERKRKESHVGARLEVALRATFNHHFCIRVPALLAEPILQHVQRLCFRPLRVRCPAARSGGEARVFLPLPERSRQRSPTEGGKVSGQRGGRLVQGLDGAEATAQREHPTLCAGDASAQNLDYGDAFLCERGKNGKLGFFGSLGTIACRALQTNGGQMCT